MEIQKTSNSQSDLEKEEWNWRNQPTRLQAPLHQNLLPGGRPQVGLLALAVIQAEKRRLSDELPTLCWALRPVLRQRRGGFKEQERQGFQPERS